MPYSSCTLTHSNSSKNSFVGLPEAYIITSMGKDMQGIETSTSSQQDLGSLWLSYPSLLLSHLWSLPYITHTTKILEAATQINGERVSYLFTASVPSPTNISSTSSASSLQPRLHPSTQPITHYDGIPGNLRSFCSQLVNQIPADILPRKLKKLGSHTNVLVLKL